MRRLTWFVSGAAAGITGSTYAAKKLKRTAAQLTPVAVARSTTSKARAAARQVTEAVRDGRAARRDREDELKARRDARLASIDDHLEPGDRILVDGRPVETGRVVVLKQRSAGR
ncbi:MAG: hypothetical protein ACO23O_15015 [Ilumatobacteraceae bacterium]